jgi:UDP-2,3-diacylglucosamine pyrophosphatase LpxH
MVKPGLFPDSLTSGMSESPVPHFIRSVLRFLLKRPVTWIANSVSSDPDKTAVMEALTSLYLEATQTKSSKVNHFSFSAESGSVIILSDQHRGTRDGSDDFAICEPSYLAALDYYDKENFYFINLGDCEELWENTIFGIMKHNQSVFGREKLFINRNAYCKVFGNHDLFWDNDPLAGTCLKKIYETVIPIYTGVVMRAGLDNGAAIDIFCTHGHQGDRQSDGNAFSKWFVSYIWGPLQSLLEINTNNPSTNDHLKTLHNSYMYEWSAGQENVLLVTGHTHQPVFDSMTHLERLYCKLDEARNAGDAGAIQKIESEIPRRQREYDFVHHSLKDMKPSYFNSGCCCFDDGTITGIEISSGFIRLIKWSLINGKPQRVVAEEERLTDIAGRIGKAVAAL